MGGFMTILGAVNQAAQLVSPYVRASATYRDEKRAAEAQSIRNQMQVDNYLNQAEEMEFNAREAERRAQAAKHAGSISEAEAAADAYKAKGRQRAMMAQNGILNSATGEALARQADGEAAGQQFKIQQKTGQEIEGLLYDADSYKRRAENYRDTAGQTAKAITLSSSSGKSTTRVNKFYSGLQTAGSLLGAISSVYRFFR